MHGATIRFIPVINSKTLDFLKGKCIPKKMEDVNSLAYYRSLRKEIVTFNV